MKKASQFKLQVPMQETVYRRLKEHSEKLGFDSVQAYVRFWATSEVHGKTPSSYQDVTRPEVQVLRYIEMLLALRTEDYESPRQAIDYVFKRLNNQRGKTYLDKWFKDLKQGKLD